MVFYRIGCFDPADLNEEKLISFFNGGYGVYFSEEAAKKEIERIYINDECQNIKYVLAPVEIDIFNLTGIKDFDQRSDYHALTLDQHTFEVVRHLEEDDFVKSHTRQKLIILAGYLHDIGKVDPEGHQVSPKDPEKFQFVGHEKVSARLAKEIFCQFFEMSNEDKEFVLILIELHAMAQNLAGNFTANPEPQGKQLKAYTNLLALVAELPGEESLIDKAKLVFAFNRADRSSNYSDESQMSAEFVETTKRQLAALDELNLALPALVQAVEAKNAGAQKAGIKKVADGYVAVVD